MTSAADCPLGRFAIRCLKCRTATASFAQSTLSLKVHLGEAVGLVEEAGSRSCEATV